MSMNINTTLDDQALFRYLLPGYSLFAVIISYFSIFHLELLRVDGAIFAFVALSGLPVGYLLQSAYRGIWVLTKEQRDMERQDRVGIEAIKDLYPHRFECFIQKYFVGDDELMRTRKMSLFIDLFLSRKGKKGESDRIYFLISRVHSAGATMLAIILGVVLVLSFIFITRCKCATAASNIFIWSMTWLLVHIFVSIYRKNIIDSYAMTSQATIRCHAEKFLDHFGC